MSKKNAKPSGETMGSVVLPNGPEIEVTAMTEGELIGRMVARASMLEQRIEALEKRAAKPLGQVTSEEMQQAIVHLITELSEVVTRLSERLGLRPNG